MKRFDNEILSPHVRLHLDRLQLLLAAGSLAGSDPRPHSTGSATAGHDEARLPPFRTSNYAKDTADESIKPSGDASPPTVAAGPCSSTTRPLATCNRH